MQGTFPSLPIDTIPALLELGRQAGIPMPDVGVDSAQNETHDRRQQTSADSIVQVDDTISSSSHAPEHVQPTRAEKDSISPSPRFVRDHYGHSHYIGPSGTLFFLPS